jgi:hypothetical protein
MILCIEIQRNPPKPLLELIKEFCKDTRYKWIWKSDVLVYSKNEPSEIELIKIIWQEHQRE